MKIKHVISTSQFDRKMLEELFRLAYKMEKLHKSRKPSKILAGKIMAAIFYEPSTRTRLSFETAMLKLGGQVISTENAAQFSSAAKGETLEDSTRVIDGYADIIIVRHPETGSVKRVADVSKVPVINAGDGSGDHPTQGLLDAYTIKNELGSIAGKTITFCGDLLNGRTVHATFHLAKLYPGVTFQFCSTPELAMPEEYINELVNRKIPFQVFGSLDDAIGSADVLYMTRIQKERFASPKEYEKHKNDFILTKRHLLAMKKKSIIMHPLPRVNEIAPEIDADPRAAYFRQAQNGLYVRMALLQMLLGK